ncbi:unnamed protein product [Diamesa serratosioi]
MAGYRCVNYFDLCRLCSSAGVNTVQIFSEESLKIDLCKKISECLSVNVSEKDKLPKGICAQCMEYITVFSDFRQISSKAQKMLEGCLNTTKLRNNNQVYIKDEAPQKKKVLKSIQNPPKLPQNISIITTSPTKPQPVKTSITNTGSDFLSSIIQAVGIQTSDDNADSGITIQAPQQVQSMPQYTLTLDGQTLKSGQIQYKIENSANLMTSPPQSVHKTLIQEQQAVDEFLKLKQKPVNTRKMTSPLAGQKSKKPKINLIVQTTPQKPKQMKTVISPPPKQFGTQSMLNTPNKSQIQIQNVDKIMGPNQTSPTKQFILPIMVRNDGQRNAITNATSTTTDASQLFTQAFTMSNNNQNLTIGDGKANSPFTYFQMKIQPNADGQLTLTPAPVQQATQQLQLSLSPQQLQQLSFQASAQNHQQQIQVQTQQVQQVQQVQQSQIPTPNIQEQIDSQTQTNLQEQKDEEPEESYDDEYEDEYFEIVEQEDEYPSLIVEPSTPPLNKLTTPVKTKITQLKGTKTVKISKSRDDSLTMLQTVQQQHSEMGQKQLESLVTHSNKRELADADKNLNLTVCNVCQKVFKRKEFLMQHLKSHIGLRPFKCETTGCNKSFSRKEHLLRHENSHTGSKSFSCNICQKKFSRKDNLNKHRRIHPESGTARFSCENCGKMFAHKSQKHKHILNCDGKNDEHEEVEVKPAPVKHKPLIKKIKTKSEKKTQEAIVTIQNPPIKAPQPTQTIQISQQQQQQHQQQQILTFLQQPQQQQQMKIKTDQQPQQIILSMPQAQSMLQAQQNKNFLKAFNSTGNENNTGQQQTVYQLPANLVLNSQGGLNFMTSSGELVGNFKFDN